MRDRRARGSALHRALGGEGRAAFERAAQRVSALDGDQCKTLLLGDFNADSRWDKELHHGLDWYAQCAANGNLHKLEQKSWLNPVFSRRPTKTAVGGITVLGATLLVLFGVSSATVAVPPPNVGGPHVYIAGGQPVTKAGPVVAIYANTLKRIPLRRHPDHR